MLGKSAPKRSEKLLAHTPHTICATACVEPRMEHAWQLIDKQPPLWQASEPRKHIMFASEIRGLLGTHRSAFVIACNTLTLQKVRLNTGRH